MNEPPRWLRHVPFLRLATPGGFLKIAATFAAVYLAVHLLGWREQTSFLSGTMPQGTAGTEFAVKGILYVLAHFAFVLGTPVFLLAAGVFTLLLKWMPGRVGVKEGQMSIEE